MNLTILRTVLALSLAFIFFLNVRAQQTNFTGSFDFYPFTYDAAQIPDARRNILVITQNSAGITTALSKREDSEKLFPFGREDSQENGDILIKRSAEIDKKGNLVLKTYEYSVKGGQKLRFKINEILSFGKQSKDLTMRREIEDIDHRQSLAIFILKPKNPPDSSDSVENIMNVKPNGQGIVNGVVLREVKPNQPPLAGALRISGSVSVAVIFDENGDVLSAEAISGHPVLRAPAVEAAMKWKFKPIEISDKATKISGIVLFNFTN